MLSMSHITKNLIGRKAVKQNVQGVILTKTRDFRG